MNPVTVITGPSVNGKRYRLEEKIGWGATGRVYRGHPVDYPHQTVAVKKPHTYYPGTEQSHRKRILNLKYESHFLQQFSHLNVVRYLDHSDHQDDLFLVVEYVPETLAHRTKTMGITQGLLADFLLQIPEILGLLQSLNVAHGDIKSHNLGYAANRLIKLFDFSAAIPLENTVVRSPPSLQRKLLCPYYPPEFREGRLVTPSFDMYTTGETLEFLLTGSYFPSAEEAIEQIENLYAISLPDSFCRLLAEMTHADHACRPRPDRLKQLCRDTVKDLSQELLFPHSPSQHVAQVQWFGEAE